MEIERLASYDELTGLPNRHLLCDRLEHAAVAGRRSGQFGALLFIELDHVQTLSDPHGPELCERLLRQTADRMCSSVRAEDTVARWGGDTFVVMLQGLGADHADAAIHAAGVGEQIIEWLGVPFDLGGVAHRSTASVGVSLFRGDHEAVDDLLRQADDAMRSAKQAGGDRLCVVNPDTQSIIDQRSRTRAELAEAADREELRLHAQPLVTGQGKVVGAELLLRWEHPQRGLLYPEHLLAHAQYDAIVESVSHWVLDQACATLATWSAEPGKEGLHLSVNIGTRQLLSDDIVGNVRESIGKADMDPRALRLEFREEALQADAAHRTLAELHALGVGLTLDAYGSGHTSVADLCRLPIDQLKIDRTLIGRVDRDEHHAATVKAMIAIAASLNITVTGVGVESEAQRDWLVSAGCDLLQGDLFGSPRPLGEFALA